MKNNKGFSLVELIIVIAIMAILVGVMAPQLIRYIEKAKVSNDTQVVDAIHTAMLTAMMDPSVIAGDSATLAGLSTTGAAITTTGTGAGSFWGEVADTMGAGPTGTISPNLKSFGATLTGISYKTYSNGNAVSVWIAGTDSTGNKTATNPDILVY
ncbi:MAG: type II secretion system protein [Lachnospiraceae bacterium]|nr:type II secretion system protein [Lachnospiraceae bacterium]